MKKKLIIIVVLVLSCFLVGCELFNPHKNEPQYKIYEMAKEVGYEGTYEEWLNTIRGIDGTSIVKVELDQDSNLIITLSNGEVINVGNVKGDKGEEIELSVVDGYIKWHYKNSNEWYNLIEVKTLIGLQGEKGNDGVSIVKVELDKDSNLIITLSNGEVINVGNVKGDKGEEIELSVVDGYIKWHYKNSNEWYNLIEVKTLIGEKGDKGEEVEISVVDGYIKWHYKNSNEWYNLIEVKTLIGLQGEKGKSAYEIYKEKHPEYTKSEEEWLDDLVNGRLATKEVHTVKFITNTIDIIEDQKVEDNKKIIKPNDPVKKGYTFIGWFNEYNEQWVFGGYNVTSDVTLYAKYTPNNYKITLDNENIIEVTYDSSFTLPVIEKEGYQFIKWINKDNIEVRSSVYKYTEDISLYSVYGKEYIITFDANGENEIQSVKAYTNIPVSLPIPVLDGYSFIGWFNGTNKVDNNFINTVEEDITLKAHYRSVVGDYEVEELENGEIKILKYKGTDKEVTIPNKINDKTVTILGESSFKDNKEIEKVILSKDIKEIDDNVFNGCTNLKEVIFNTGISTYKDNILLNCISLESITIDVLNQALVGFFDYEESNIPETFTNINFLSKDKASNTSKMFNNISSHLFSINIPSSWEEVPGSYFQNNILIKEVNIEEGITKIGVYAFEYCSALQTINLSDNITNIGGGAFAYCSALQFITLPKNIINIGGQAFRNCSSLATITMPKSITNIGDNAFSRCTSLQTINLSDNITKIGANAFAYCSALQFITLPKNIINIGSQAFMNCSSLATITMPKSITNIGGGAFEYCSALTDVFYEGSKSNLINNVNMGTNNEQLINASFHYESNVICDYIKNDKYEYVLSTENKIYSLKCFDNSASNINLIDDFKDYEVVTIKPGGFMNLKNLEIIVMPNTITKIGNYAFEGCSSLKDITLSNNLTELTDSVFYGCTSLEFVELPKKCSIINSLSFYGCTSLKSLIMSSNSYIVGSRFSNCRSLKEIYLIESNNSVNFENLSSIENFDSLVFYLYSETQPVDEGNYWHYVDGQVTIW